VCYITLFALSMRDLLKFIDRFDTRNSPHVYCLIAMGFQAFGILCDLIHNLKYRTDGEGLLVMDVFGTIFDMVGECIMTLLVLMMANGWYTRYMKFDYDDGMEVYGPLWILVLMIHIVFGAFTYVDNDAYHKYHDYHGWIGHGIICAKLLLVVVFIYFYSYCHSEIKNKQSLSFYRQFVPVGVMYLLSDPVIILSCYCLQEYNRQSYYRMVDQFVHIGLQAYIFYQLSQNKSSFTKSVHSFSSLPTETEIHKLDK